MEEAIEALKEGQRGSIRITQELVLQVADMGAYLDAGFPLQVKEQPGQGQHG